MWKRKDKSWLEDTALEKMLVRYGKNAFRLFMFPKAETYVFLVGNVSFGFGKHTFPVGETYNLKSATPFPKCYLHKEKWTFDS